MFDIAVLKYLRSGCYYYALVTFVGLGISPLHDCQDLIWSLSMGYQYQVSGLVWTLFLSQLLKGDGISISSTTAFFRISITCSLSSRCELCSSAMKLVWCRLRFLKLLTTANELVSLYPKLLDLKTPLMDSIDPDSLRFIKHLKHAAGKILGFLLYKLIYWQLGLCSSP